MADFSNLNHLDTDTKLLLVNGQALVDKTRAGIKEKGYLIGLAGKGQLKDDCKAVERLIKKFEKGKVKEKDAEELKLAIVRLTTTSEGLFQYKY